MTAAGGRVGSDWAQRRRSARLVLGFGGEGDLGDAVGLSAADLGAHLRGQQVFGVDLATVGQIHPLDRVRGVEQQIEFGGRLIALGRMRLVGDDGEALAFGRGELADRFKHERGRSAACGLRSSGRR